MSAADWDAAMAGFESELVERDRKPSTIETYLRHVGWLRDGTAAGPWDLAMQDIEKWANERRWSKATTRGVFVSLRAFYGWAVRVGTCEKSPLVGLAVATPRGVSGPEQTAPSPLWVEPLAGFRRHLVARGLLPRTVAQYRILLTAFSHCFGDPTSVTTQDVEDYISRADWSAEYRHHVRSTLQRFYGWAEREQLVAVNPASGLAPIRRPRALPRPTPTDELIDALARADRRTRLVIELAMYAGLRISEIAGLRMTDLAGDQLRIKGKGNRERYVPIHPELRKTLRGEISRRIEAGVESPWLFPSPQDDDHMGAHYLSTKVTACFQGRWTAHTLRHRFATQAYAATRDLRAVQELLGHTMPETTAIYVAVPSGARMAAVAGVGVL